MIERGKEKRWKEREEDKMREGEAGVEEKRENQCEKKKRDRERERERETEKCRKSNIFSSSKVILLKVNVGLKVHSTIYL